MLGKGDEGKMTDWSGTAEGEKYKVWDAHLGQMGEDTEVTVLLAEEL